MYTSLSQKIEPNTRTKGLNTLLDSFPTTLNCSGNIRVQLPTLAELEMQTRVIGPIFAIEVSNQASSYLQLEVSIQRKEKSSIMVAIAVG